MNKKNWPDPAMVPGVAREDDEGNDKTYEHEMVTKYWLDHYCTEHCTLCGNSGIIDTRAVTTPAGISVCICPNGQAMRWHKAAGATERD